MCPDEPASLTPNRDLDDGRGRPLWLGPPRGTLPGVVALELVLAQTDRHAVCISRLLGYPTGFAFEVIVLSAPGAVIVGAQPPTVTVQFANGAIAQPAGTRRCEPPAPTIRAGRLYADHGGAGCTHWVWPLPPPGPLYFICEWPALGIRDRRSQLDAENVLYAAQRAHILFPD